MSKRCPQQQLPDPNHCIACGSVLLIANGQATCCRRGCERYGAPAPKPEERR
jgi:hypothetical protein